MTFDVKAVMDGNEDKMSIHMPFSLGFKGTWKDMENKMVWTPTDSSQYCKFEKDSIKITFGDPTMEALGDKLVKSFTENLEKEMAPNMLKDFESSEPMDYILDGDELKIVNKNDTMVFHRQK